MAPGALAAIVDELTYGQLQVALHAADIPSKGHIGLPVAEIAKLAAQGLERLGYERVCELDCLYRQINHRFLTMLADAGKDTGRTALRAAWTAALAPNWPNRRRMQRCTDMAYKYTSRNWEPVTGR
jgi:hypothetical protein